MKVLKFLALGLFFVFGAARADNLIVYFSESGNTERVATTIQKLVGGDMARIEAVIPYPNSDTDKTYVAKREQETEARPEYVDLGIDVADYDVIFLGYPTWWGKMPMIMYTFLENNNFNRKIIIPFNTYASSGAGDSFSEIKRVARGATVMDGFSMRGRETTEDHSEKVKEWLTKLLD